MTQPNINDTDVLFLNLDLGKSLTGIEHSALARAALFIDELGINPLIVTFQYRPKLKRNVRRLLSSERYHSATRVIGLYDFLQDFADPAVDESDRHGFYPPTIDPDFPGFTPTPVKGFKDVRYLDDHGALFAYKVYSKEHGELTHINYFEKGKKVAADIYHDTGHRSSHRLIDPVSQRLTHEIHYSPWGTPLFFRVFENPEASATSQPGLAPGFYLHVALTVTHPASRPIAAPSQPASRTERPAIDHIARQCSFLGDSTAFSLYALDALTSQLTGRRLLLLNDKNKFTFKPSVMLRDAPKGANEAKSIRVLSAIHNTHYQGEEPDGTLKSHYRDVLGSQYVTDGIITLTQAQQLDIQNRYPEKSVITVPHTLSASYKALDSKNHKGGVTEVKKIICVARLSPEKQHLMALEIFAEVLTHAPNARLHLYGEGSERSKIEAKIKALKLEGSVVLEGYCADVTGIYEGAHCAILTSRMEGFSLALLEAMAFRCPVVAFDINYGPGDLITPNETGFLVAQGDKAAFARHLVNLLETPGLAEKLGQNAYEKFVEHYSAASVAKRWEQAITESFL